MSQPPRQPRGPAPEGEEVRTAPDVDPPDGPTRSDEPDVVDVHEFLERRRAVIGDAPPYGEPAPRRWRWVAPLALVLLVVVIAWSAVAWRTAAEVRGELTDARDELTAGAEALVAGDFTTARDTLADAARRFESVPTRLRSPAVLPARFLPSTDRAIDAVTVMAESAGDVASTASVLADELSARPGGLGALTPSEGRIPVGELQSLAPAFVDMADALATARSRVQQLPQEGIDADVVEARDAFLEVVRPAADQAAAAAQLLVHLPELLGAEEPRRYMVGASNPTEARGTGGFIGAFSILTVEDGDLRFSSVRPIQDLDNVPYGEIDWPDASLAGRYADYGGAGFWLNINMTPDFPTAAQAIINLYEAVEGVRLDGVMAVDPFAFEALLELSGPVTLRGVGEVAADEVVAFVANEAYSTITDFEERKRLLGQIAIVAFDAFLDNPGGTDLESILEAFGTMVARESLVIYVEDPEIQQALRTVGITGGLPELDQQQYLAVVLNSGTGSKIDYYLQRRVDHEVVISADGSATAHTTSTLRNTAPRTGEPAYVIGPNTPALDAGDNLLFVSTYCEPGCAFQDVPPPGYAGLATTREVELGFGVSSTWTRIASGEEVQHEWTSVSPDVLREAGGAYRYTLVYDHQASMNPVELAVEVEVPSWLEVIDAPDGAVVEDGVLRWADDVVEDVELVVRLADREAGALS